MVRVAFYSHDTYGLGHLRRCLKLAAALPAQLGPVRGLLITGSPWAWLFPAPPGFRYVTLPPVVKVDAEAYRPRTGGVPLGSLVAARGRRIRAALRRLRPHLFLVDNVPCGLAGEVVPALRDLGGQPGARRVLILRDIVDEPATARSQWAMAGADEVLQELYDEIWVFGEPEVLDPRDSYALPPSAAERVVFCGYLGAGAVARRPAGRPGGARRRPAVLVTGGGGGDAGPLVGTYLEVLRRYRPRLDSRIALGPDFPESEYRRAFARDGFDARVRRFVPDLPRAMAEADVVVSMAGYNTVSETRAAGCPVVLVPRVWPRREQWLRARRLAAGRGGTVLHPEELTPRSLWEALQAALESPPPPAVAAAGEARAAARAAALLGVADRGR